MLSRLIRPAIWIAFAVAAAAVVYFTLQPGFGPPSFMWRDKIQHLEAYGTLSLLAGLGSRTWRQAAWWAVGLAVAAYILEIVQPFVGRSYDLLDQAANMIGCLLGFTASQIIHRVVRRVSRTA